MQRTKTLTTKHIKAYKIGHMLLFFVGILAIVYASLKSRMTAMMFVMIPFFFYTIYMFFRNFDRIRQVEYDDANLYVWHNDYQIQIPFEEIREVNLESGGYVFMLYKKTQVGKEVLCLPSIWYPFNYKKVDAEMNRVREMIAKRKREVYKKSGDAAHQLSSLNL